MRYSDFLQIIRVQLNGLLQRKVFFITNFSDGGLLQDKLKVEYNSSCFKDEELEILTNLIKSSFFNDYKCPVIIDAVKAMTLCKKMDGSSDEKERKALSYSRISFMGTDGMRGKVVTECNGDYLSAFIYRNVLMPEIIKLASYSFGRMLSHSGEITYGDTICVCNDGRDITTGWKLRDSMIDGFHASGQRVLDLGIAPTPIVPFKMLKSGMTAGAVLTASHNPSNQNGIKFFFQGKKILPEGIYGDYSLAAWMYYYFLRGVPKGEPGTLYQSLENVEFTKLILSALPGNAGNLLKNTFIILDNANGAFAELSVQILNKLNLDYLCVNEKPVGNNINKSCGVAEIEGHEEFSASDCNSSIRVISELFSQGRCRDGDTFALVLDGDGDRGFVLYYNRKKDRIQVIDGDKSGCLLAEYFLKSGRVPGSDAAFLVTVESDIMTSYYAANNLGLKTKVVSVGDKWICNYNEGELFLGLESSGHLIFPVPFNNDKGEEVFLHAGNGLLSSLLTLTAVKALGLSEDRIAIPYVPGYSGTFYTYFVDKSLFYRDSRIWNQDREIITKSYEKLKKTNSQFKNSSLVFGIKEDVHMLYASIIKDKLLFAAIFCRNSGTEDKISVYIKCQKKFEHLLYPVGVNLNRNHIERMKNRNSIEFEYETAILAEIPPNDKVLIPGMKQILENRFSRKISDSEFSGVLYGLKKEGRIIFDSNSIGRDRIGLMLK